MEIKQYSIEQLRLGKVMIVIKPINEQGDFDLVEYGVGFVPASTGITMVIDEKYVDQLHKFKLVMNNMFQPTLKLKEGEIFDEPQVDEDAQRELELQRELEAIRQRQIQKDTIPAEQLENN